MNAEERAAADAPRLRADLDALLALCSMLFASKLRFAPDDHMAFMALAFTAKQSLHAQSTLALGDSPDGILVARSMFEGLCQLLWANQARQDRPLRWRMFAFVVDWRKIRDDRVAGRAAPPTALVENNKIGLQLHGALFLTPAAQKTQDAGLALPDDPYMRNWYGEREKEIFAAVDADVVYKELYGPFSEWHHWRVGALGQMIRYNEKESTFQMTGTRPSFTASALSSAFQCLWQTMAILDGLVDIGIRNDLERVYQEYVTHHKRVTAGEGSAQSDVSTHSPTSAGRESRQ